MEGPPSKKRKEDAAEAPSLEAPTKKQKAETAVASVLLAETPGGAICAALEAYPASALVAEAAFKRAVELTDPEDLGRAVEPLEAAFLKHSEVGALGVSALGNLAPSAWQKVKEPRRVAEVAFGVAKAAASDEKVKKTFVGVVRGAFPASLDVAVAALEEFEMDGEFVAHLASTLAGRDPEPTEALVLAIGHVATLHGFGDAKAVEACAALMEVLVGRGKAAEVKEWVKKSRVARVFAHKGVGKAVVEFVD
jgi:hypothetical protein